jgi:hypothetical protein
VFDDVRNVEYGAIVGWYFGGRREEEVATSTTARFRFGEIAGIAVRCLLHVAGVVCDDGIFLGRDVIE